jgi:hypothetical protein
MEVSGQIHAPASVPLGKEPPRDPLDSRLCEPQSRSRRCGEEKNFYSLQLGAHCYTDWAVLAPVLWWSHGGVDKEYYSVVIKPCNLGRSLPIFGLNILPLSSRWKMKVEAAHSSETSLNIYLIARCHIPEEANIYQLVSKR